MGIIGPSGQASRRPSVPALSGPRLRRPAAQGRLPPRRLAPWRSGKAEKPKRRRRRSKSGGPQVVRSPSRQVVRSSGRHVVRSPGRRVVRSPGRQVAHLDRPGVVRSSRRQVARRQIFTSQATALRHFRGHNFSSNGHQRVAITPVTPGILRQRAKIRVEFAGRGISAARSD